MRRNLEGCTASEILDMADDGQVMLFNRSAVLLRQIQEDKTRSVVKRNKEIVRVKQNLTKAGTDNPATVPQLKQHLAKLEAEQRTDLRDEILNTRKKKFWTLRKD